MRSLLLRVAVVLALPILLLPARAADVEKLVPALKQGGYVIVVRHTAL